MNWINDFATVWKFIAAVKAGQISAADFPTALGQALQALGRLAEEGGTFGQTLLAQIIAALTPAPSPAPSSGATERPKFVSPCPALPIADEQAVRKVLDECHGDHGLKRKFTPGPILTEIGQILADIAPTVVPLLVQLIENALTPAPAPAS